MAFMINQWMIEWVSKLLLFKLSEMATKFSARLKNKYDFHLIVTWFHHIQILVFSSIFRYQPHAVCVYLYWHISESPAIDLFSMVAFCHVTWLSEVHRDRLDQIWWWAGESISNRTATVACNSISESCYSILLATLHCALYLLDLCCLCPSSLPNTCWAVSNCTMLHSLNVHSNTC